MPSTVSRAPRAFSRYCSERTVTAGHALLLPCRSTGHAGSAAAASAPDTTSDAALSCPVDAVTGRADAAGANISHPPTATTLTRVATVPLIGRPRGPAGRVGAPGREPSATSA